METLPIYSNPRLGSGEKIGPYAYTLSILLYRFSYEVITFVVRYGSVFRRRNVKKPFSIEEASFNLYGIPR